MQRRAHTRTYTQIHTRNANGTATKNTHHRPEQQPSPKVRKDKRRETNKQEAHKNGEIHLIFSKSNDRERMTENRGIRNEAASSRTRKLAAALSTTENDAIDISQRPWEWPLGSAKSAMNATLQTRRWVGVAVKVTLWTRYKHQKRAQAAVVVSCRTPEGCLIDTGTVALDYSPLSLAVCAAFETALYAGKYLSPHSISMIRAWKFIPINIRLFAAR